MILHLTAIIPLMVGLILLVIGLSFSQPIIVWMSTVVSLYGVLVHTNNVAIIRRQGQIYQRFWG
jgi:hypothetical protein